MFPTVMNLLSVGVFSCERIVANFLTFVQHNRQKSCGEKFSFVEGDKKFIIFLLGGWLNLVTFHFFLVGAINMFSELIHPLLKLPNCVLKQQLHILQIFEVLGSLFSLFEEQDRLCRCTASSTHFWSSRKHDIAHGNSAQDCFANTWYSVHHKIQSQVPTIAHAILLQNQSPGVSNLQRGQSCEVSFDTLTTFLNSLVRMNLLYGKWTVGFFSLASQAGALHPRQNLMLLLLYSKPILRKNWLFCSLLLPVYMHFLFSLFYSHSSFIYLSIHFSLIYSYFLFNWSFASDSESKWWWGMKICRTNSQIPLNPPLLHSVEQQYGFSNIPPLSDWVGLVNLL